MNFLRIGLFVAATVFSSACVFAQNTDEDQGPRPLSRLTLEAHAVTITLNDEHRSGVDWEAIVTDFHNLQLKKEDNPIWADKKYKVSVGTVSSEDYAVLLDALDTVGRVEPLPQDTVTLAVDVKESFNVFFGENRPSTIRLDTLLSNSSKGEPQIHIEPFIEEIFKDSGKSVAVTLKTQTDILLKDNTTIVIGGIIAEQEITKTHKFPLLGDLPILGLVFRSRGRLMQKTETVVFLTTRFKAIGADKSNE